MGVLWDIETVTVSSFSGPAKRDSLFAGGR